MSASRDPPVRLKAEERRQLYAARRYIPRTTQEALGLYFEVDVYFKDPQVAAEVPAISFDVNYQVPWEPRLADGPTSARFAVVDFDSTTRHLEPAARWDGRQDVFRGPRDEVLCKDAAESAQYRQVSTWAIVQATLDHFEGAFGLGRRIAWGFEGSRLIVVPHAGYGQNAFYDRASKSLQFYYFDHDGKRIYTCLSTDIVTHEFGHALLDGIRPRFLEAVLPETAAFHEFMGDVTALLMVFRNNRFRKDLERRTGGDLAGDPLLAGLAHEFGKAVDGNDYLRSAADQKTMAQLDADMEPHDASTVLTGAVFDLLVDISVQYRAHTSNMSVADILWNTVNRLQRMVIQALDLLPPVEATFRDYALAMLRAEFVGNPTDPDGYGAMMAKVFVRRGILTEAEALPLLAPQQVFARIPYAVFHDVRQIAVSPASAYRFLDDNRRELLIPHNVDVVVDSVFTAEKLGREGRRLPRQVIVQYVWREEVVLAGERFGRYAGQATTMLCGATLVLDDDGNVVCWARKPGSLSCGTGKAAVKEQQDGVVRRDRYLDAVATHVAAGTLGEVHGGAAGLLAESVPLLAVTEHAGSLRFTLTPHLSAGCRHGDHDRRVPWQPSS